MLKRYLDSVLRSPWLTYYAWPNITDGVIVCRSLWIDDQVWNSLSHLWMNSTVVRQNTRDLDELASTYLRSDINTSVLSFFNGLFSLLERPRTVYIPPIDVLLPIVSKSIVKEPKRERFSVPQLEDLDKNVYMGLPVSRTVNSYRWIQDQIDSFWR